MFAATLITAALFIAKASAELTIQTPTFVQCQDAKIQWGGNNGSPINIIVVPADDACGDVIHDLGDHSKSSMTWKVALPAGAKVLLSLEGDNEDEAWSQEVVVGPSTDSSCVPKELLALGAATPSSVSAVLSASASSTASAAARTTLSLVGNVAAVPKASAIPNSDSDDSEVEAVGAAKEGILGSGASTVAAPVMVLSAMAAVVALVL